MRVTVNGHIVLIVSLSKHNFGIRLFGLVIFQVIHADGGFYSINLFRKAEYFYSLG